MTINEFMKQNPNHPLTHTLEAMGGDCSPDDYANTQCVASGMVMLLGYQGQLGPKDLITMLEQIGTPIRAGGSTAGSKHTH